MKKNDLRSGMRVFTKEGNEYLVINDFRESNYNGDILCNMRRESFMPLSGYNENLESNTDIFTICKVLSPKSPNVVLSRNMLNFDVIWERRQISELTQFEYDLLSSCASDTKFMNHSLLKRLVEKGYFKGMRDKDMLISRILENCKIID